MGEWGEKSIDQVPGCVGQGDVDGWAAGGEPSAKQKKKGKKAAI